MPAQLERTTMNQLNEEQKKQILTKDTELQVLRKKISSVGDKQINDARRELESKMNSKLERCHFTLFAGQETNNFPL